MECCRNGCPSKRFSSLHRAMLELRLGGDRDDHSDKGPSTPTGWVSSSTKSPGVSNFFHLWIIEAAVLTGISKAAETFPYASPDLRLDTIQSWRSTDNPLNFMVWFVLCTLNCGILYRPVLVVSSQLSLPQVDSKQAVETLTGVWRKPDAPELSSVCHDKGCKYLIRCYIFVYFLIHLQTFQANHCPSSL